MIEITTKKGYAVPSGTMTVNDNASDFSCVFGFYGDKAVKFTSTVGKFGEIFLCGHYDTAARTKEIVESLNSALRRGKKTFVMPKK